MEAEKKDTPATRSVKLRPSQWAILETAAKRAGQKLHPWMAETLLKRATKKVKA